MLFCRRNLRANVISLDKLGKLSTFLRCNLELEILEILSENPILCSMEFDNNALWECWLGWTRMTLELIDILI